MQLGILSAFLAMFLWGIGDFLMQKVIRKIGIFETLFAITTVGIFLIFPFVYKDLGNIFLSDKALCVLIVSSFVLFIAAILDFMALKVGKLSVVEPIWSLEIVSASMLAFWILGEKITIIQIILIAILIAGLIFVSIEKGSELKGKDFLEKGAILAVISAITMGGANFLFGWSARLTDALSVNFFSCVVLSFLSFLVLLFRGNFKKGLTTLFNYKKVVLPMCILDNLAWIAFAKGMSLSPIAIVTALSESYIIIAVILGLSLNKEKIGKHQKVGLAIALISAITLSYFGS
jgi:drug/metabolite transporter (DMT)-like permease